MKQTKIFFITVLALMMSAVCFADDNPIPAENLPKAAKSFIQKKFPNAKVEYAEREHDGFECMLDNGIELEFNRKGEWIKIDGSVRTALPEAVVPEPISKYVKQNYPELKITEIEKGRYGYKVEMSNKYNLKFTRHGKFIGKNH